MNPIWFLYLSPFGCFLKWWVSPTTTGFPTKIDPFGVWNGGTPIFGNTHLHPWHPLTIFLDHSSLPTKHQPVYRRGIAWSWFPASVLRQSAQALWVLPHLQAIFKGSLKFPAPTTTNNNQPQPQPQTSQPTNQQNQSCEPTSWVDAVVLASDNATSPWCGIVCKCRKTFTKICLASCCSVCSFKCFTKSSMSAAWKICTKFSSTLFFGASYSRSKSHQIKAAFFVKLRCFSSWSCQHPKFSALNLRLSSSSCPTT